MEDIPGGLDGARHDATQHQKPIDWQSVSVDNEGVTATDTAHISTVRWLHARWRSTISRPGADRQRQAKSNQGLGQLIYSAWRKQSAARRTRWQLVRHDGDESSGSTGAPCDTDNNY